MTMMISNHGRHQNVSEARKKVQEVGWEQSGATELLLGDCATFSRRILSELCDLRSSHAKCQRPGPDVCQQRTVPLVEADPQPAVVGALASSYSRSRQVQANQIKIYFLSNNTKLQCIKCWRGDLTALGGSVPRFFRLSVRHSVPPSPRFLHCLSKYL